jgi:hypothetical protein
MGDGVRREMRDGRGPLSTCASRVEKNGANSGGLSDDAGQRLVLVRGGQLGPVRSRGRRSVQRCDKALSTRQTLWGCSNLDSSTS